MKLVHPDWKHQIEFQEGKVSLLIVENPMLMYKYVKNLNQQCDGIQGEFVLSEEGQELALEKNAFVFLNPFEVDINNRKIITKLYAELKAMSVEDELYLETNRIIGEVEAYIEKLADESEYALEYDNQVDISGIFKLFNVRLAKDSDSILELLIDYMDVMQKISHKTLCICVNMKNYLTEEDVEKIYLMAEYRKMHILMIEAREPDNVLNKENKFIIDKTGCEIY